MTRYRFGGGVTDVYLVEDPQTGFLKPGPGEPALFFADFGLQLPYTDLKTLDGDPLGSVTTQTSGPVYAAGQIAALIGPDEVTEMWCSVNGSPPFLMVTNSFPATVQDKLTQLQQLLDADPLALADLAGVDPVSLAAASLGNPLVMLESGLWGADTMISGFGDAASLDIGVTAGTVAGGDAAVQTTGGGLEGYGATTAASADKTISLANGNVQRVLLGAGTVTLALTGATVNKACSLSLYLAQDGTGNRSVAWPASVKWPGGVAPSLSAAPGGVDLVVLETVDGGATWYATLGGLGFA